MNSINKDEAGDLSNIILNINARTRAHDGLVLREGPSVDTKQLDLIPYGTNLRVISLCNGFKYGSGDPMVLTEYNGKRGYVHSRYILIDNNIDISSYSLEQKYAFGVLYYNQAQTITFDFWHNGGIADCTPTQEYEQVSNGNYEKLLPQGVTIAQVTSDFYKYFSTDYSYNDANDKIDFNHYYIEKDGYLWRVSGFGDDPSWDYDEVIEMTSNTTDKLRFKVIHHYAPQFYDHYGCEYKEYLLSLRLENGLWKIDAPFTIQ